MADCPVAIITPRSKELLNTFSRASRTHELAGASLFGPNLAEWPAWAVDAAETIRVCEIKEHNSRVETEISENQTR